MGGDKWDCGLLLSVKELGRADECKATFSDRPVKFGPEGKVNDEMAARDTRAVRETITFKFLRELREF